MLEKDLAQAFRTFIQQHEYVCLSTIDESGSPETRALINLGCPKLFPDLQRFFSDDFAAYFSTNTSSAKIGQLALNRKCAVYYFDTANIEGLLLVGEMETVEDMAVKRAFWQKGWDLYYKDGVEDPDYTLLKFVPKRYKRYGKLQVIAGEF